MRAIIQLSETEKKELETLKRTEKNNKIYRRYMYLEMSNRGMTNLEISSILGVCNDTLTDWRVLFTKGGLEGISRLNYENQGKKSKLLPIKKDILKKIKNRNISTLKELQFYIKEEHSIEVEQSWLSRFCKKNSIYLIKKLD